jgi:hypothetical protein
MARMPVISFISMLLLAASMAAAPAQQRNPPPDGNGREAERPKVEHEQERPKVERTGSVDNPESTARTLQATGPNVPDLKLPTGYEVNYDDMFTDVTAECNGPVTWLVVSNTEKVKYKLHKDGDTTITVGIPPRECVISVFCVGFVNNHFTNWARTDIHVKANQGPRPPPGPEPGPGPGPTPGPGPLPTPAPAGTKLQFTIVEDPLARTVETRNVVESIKARQTLAPGNILRDRNVNDPLLATFKSYLASKGIPTPAIVVQTYDGTRTPKPPLYAGPLPKTEAELVQLINTIQGGK